LDSISKGVVFKCLKEPEHVKSIIGDLVKIDGDCEGMYLNYMAE